MKLNWVNYFVHSLYVDSSLIQSKECWFWNEAFLWKVSSALTLLIVAKGKHGHFECLALQSKGFLFQNNFLFDFVCLCVCMILHVASSLVIISRVRHVLYNGLPLTLNKAYWF